MRVETKLLIAFMLLGLLAIGVSSGFMMSGERGVVPLPTLSDEGPITLRVAYIENPQLGTFSAPEWEKVLSTAASEARSHFGLDLRFSAPARLDLARIFSRLDHAMPHAVKNTIAPFRSSAMNWDRMVAMVEPTLPETARDLADASDYLEAAIGRDLGPLQGTSVEERRRVLAKRAVDVLRERLDAIWREAPSGLDGGSAREGKPGYNEWVYWDALPALDLPYDVYLTNQGVISVEFARYPLHVITRGGVTAGTTSGASEGTFGAAAWVSAFPFLDNSTAITALRGGRVYPREEAIRLTGLLLAHELGHLLLHLGHPWGDTACVMYPVPQLRFHDAAAALDAPACPLGYNAAMTPGHATIYKPAFAEE